MVAVSVPQAAGKERLVRQALTGNAIFSAISGGLFIAASGAVSRFTGLEPAWIPAAIGVGVIGWTSMLVALLRRDSLSTGVVKAIIAGDLIWVAASYGVLVAGRPELTTGGSWAIAILAEVVAVFALLQYVGLRRMRGARS